MKFATPVSAATLRVLPAVKLPGPVWTEIVMTDVFVVQEYRGRGLSKWLMQVMLTHPALQGLRRWFLLTKDAQGLYEQVGFTYSEGIEHSYMEIRDADVYKRPANG